MIDGPTSEAFLPSRLPQSLFFRASITCTLGDEIPARLCRSAIVCALSWARKVGLLNTASICKQRRPKFTSALGLKQSS